MHSEGIAFPEAELRNDFAENPDGSVGSRMNPVFVPQAIMAGDYKHDYSQIRAPVLAFVGYPPIPQDEIRGKDITGPAERTIIEAVFGVNVGLIKNRIKRINSAAEARASSNCGAQVVSFSSPTSQPYYARFAFFSEDCIKNLVRWSAACFSGVPDLEITCGSSCYSETVICSVDVKSLYHP